MSHLTADIKRTRLEWFALRIRKKWTWVIKTISPSLPISLYVKARTTMVGKRMIYKSWGWRYTSKRRIKEKTGNATKEAKFLRGSWSQGMSQWNCYIYMFASAQTKECD
jgi:hypothetical protein